MKKTVKLLIIVLLTFPLSGKGQSLDARWLHAVNSNSTPFLDGYSSAVSTSVPYVSIGLPVVFLASGYLANNEKLVTTGLYSLTTLALSVAFTYEMKYIVRRDRPYDRYPGYIIPRNGLESTPSFPSMHTSMAFNTATALTLQYPKWYVAVPSYLWAGSVAYARMNEGVHYPTDVLAGAAIGVGCAYLNYKLNQWLNKPFDKISRNTLRLIYD